MAKFVGLTKDAEDFVSRFNQVDKRDEDNITLRSWKTADGVVKEIVQPSKNNKVFTCLEVPSDNEVFLVFEWEKDKISKPFDKKLGKYS